MTSFKRSIFAAFSVVIFICFVSFGFFANAETMQNVKSSKSSGSAEIARDARSYNAYVIKHYNIDIVYNENNIAEIVETFEAYFNAPRHGLMRKIPLIGEFLKPDGSGVKYNARICDVSCCDKHQILKENGDCVIKIGDPLEIVSGKKDYVLKYKYELGRDRLTDADQIYYNLVGDHEVAYENVTFSITLPKDFDASKLGFTAGEKGLTSGASKVKFNIDGTKITGSYDGALEAGECLTVRCELPEGYFSRNYGGAFICQVVICVLAVLVLLVVLLRFFAVKKKVEDFGPLVEPVEFYPPDEMNSVDAAYIYRGGNIDSQNVMSLLVYLANKGYIKISSQSDDPKDFVITKIKDYDGDNESERLFFEGLFESGRDEVRHGDLYNNFYKTVNSIRKKLINPAGNRFKIFSKVAMSAGRFAFFGLFFISVLTTLVTVLDWIDINMVVEAGVQYIDKTAAYCLVAVVAIATGVLIAYFAFFSRQSLVGGSMGLLCAFLPWAVAIFVLISDMTYLIVNCVGIVCAVLVVVFARFLPKYTKYGHEITGRIRGFRNFLLAAEKEKLEALVEDDPEYFYNILPYTYVFKISDQWIKKFESIAIEEPSWYDGADAFDIYCLDRSLSSITHHALEVEQKSSSYSSSSSSWGSGSSGSGGGSSGGGYGGGSTSSW